MYRIIDQPISFDQNVFWGKGTYSKHECIEKTSYRPKWTVFNSVFRRLFRKFWPNSVSAFHKYLLSSVQYFCIFAQNGKSEFIIPRSRTPWVLFTPGSFPFGYIGVFSYSTILEQFSQIGRFRLFAVFLLLVVVENSTLQRQPSFTSFTFRKLWTNYFKSDVVCLLQMFWKLTLGILILPGVDPRDKTPWGTPKDKENLSMIYKMRHPRVDWGKWTTNRQRLCTHPKKLHCHQFHLN